MQDPEAYLVARGIELQDYFDAARPALLDPQYRAQVNWEFYFFANAKELSRFRSDPEHYCDVVTDPVSRMRFRPGDRSPRTEHGGKPFFFESEANLALFTATPDSFAVPRPRMGMPQHERK